MKNPPKQHIRLKYKWVIATLLILVLALSIILSTIQPGPEANKKDISHLESVTFKVIDEASGAPIRNYRLDFYRRDLTVYFVQPAASPYTPNNPELHLTSATTDSHGIFVLDLSSIDVMDFVIGPEQPYYIQGFERSSDLSHTQSPDHIRVVQFKPGTTQVLANKIYDLKHKTAKIIPLAGEPQETPYEEITLTVRRAIDLGAYPEASTMAEETK